MRWWPWTRRERGEISRGGQMTLDQFAAQLAAAADAGVVTTTGSQWRNEEHLPTEFESIVANAFKRSGVVWACELARAMVFGSARFLYQRFEDGRPGKLFHEPGLAALDRPRRGETTRKMLVRMLLDADLSGTAILTRRPSGQIRRARPDWCTLLVGSVNDPMMVGDDLDAELLGVLYEPPNGRHELLLAEETATFAPIPDPTGWFRGIPWLTPIMREMQADQAATEHRLKFFKNGATVNMSIVFEPTMTLEQVKKFKAFLDEEHKGVANAYKTLYLLGAKPVPVGSDFGAQGMDLKNISGLSETRVAAAAGVHPVILGLSEGLQGSSLNAGNYGQVRRRFADITMHPLWEEAAACLEILAPPPNPDSDRLWYDVRDVPFLREDRDAVAKIQQAQGSAAASFHREGWDPDSIIETLDAEDLTLLKHTGLPSVQVQRPAETPTPTGPRQPEAEGQ